MAGAKFDASKMMTGFNQKMSTDTKPVEKKTERTSAGARVMINQIPAESIHEAAENMFSQFKDENYEILVKSIETDGIHDALKVERDAKNPGEYILISGHRRFMAAKELGLKTVPCVVIDSMTDEERETQILRENLGKRSVDPFGFAMQTKRIIERATEKDGEITNIRKFIEEKIGVAKGGPTQRLVVLVTYGQDFLLAGQQGFLSVNGAQELYNRTKESGESLKTYEDKILDIHKSALSDAEKKAEIEKIIHPEEPKKEAPAKPKHAGGRPVKTANAAEMVGKISKSFDKIQKIYDEHPNDQDKKQLRKELTALKNAVDELLGKLN